MHVYIYVCICVFYCNDFLPGLFCLDLRLDASISKFIRRLEIILFKTI